MMRWLNIPLGTTQGPSHIRCNDATPPQCCSCTESVGASLAFLISMGPVIKARERPWLQPILFHFICFPKKITFSSTGFSFIGAVRRVLSVTEDINLTLWPVVKHQLSWRALLFLSEMRLVCKFLSNPYHAYLLVSHLECLLLYFAQMLLWPLTGLGSFYMSKSI